MKTAAVMAPPGPPGVVRVPKPRTVPMDPPAVVRPVLLTIVPPAAVLSCNATGGLHHAVKGRWVKAWRTAAQEAAEAQLDGGLLGYRIQVQAVLPVRKNLRRDPANYSASVVKAIRDGLTESGLVWPDDDHLWCTELEPVLDLRAERVTVRLVATSACSEVCCTPS